ncbi:MAG: S-layer homology domain-containing protein, partial [Oscillospiraceae bacterium]|nr:S-layer homology domain-containing protein [Oscillospiraceae bacterium]
LRRGHWMSEDVALAGWRKIKDPIFAQILYLLNGNTAEGLHYADTERNPERLEDEVREVIETYGEFVPESQVMTNFGFAALRNGVDYTNNITDPTTTDTRRDVWMYFGTNDGHAHDEDLNLGMTAFGLDFLPDNGYPETTGTQPNRLQWVSTALSHNTVMVNERSQDTNAEARGEAHHFDLGEKVQVMDVSASYLYPEIDEYRRSVVTVEVDDANSYTVDFFRVLGGNDHLYSFHATSNEIREYSGLEFDTVYENGEYVTGSQVDENGKYKGSYAGIDVPFGQDPNSPAEWAYETVYPRGYTWIENVDRDNTPAEKVELDFKITDFKKSLKDSKGLGLHMTVFNGGNMKEGVRSEFSIADAYPPRKGANKQIDKFKYVLIKHSGENLDTTYTTVLEPYKQNRYLKSADELTLISDKPAAEGASARALRIGHTNGRVDYVFYSTDNTVTYTVTDGGRDISFRGFVGVYSIQNGVNIYKYVCDGDIIGENTGKKAGIYAKVKSFTDTLAEENFITLTPSEPVSDEELSDLAGRFVFVDNGDAVRSGTWEIEGADRSGSDIVLDVGRITTIRKHTNASLFSAGYNFIIAEGQNAYIPLSFADDNAPEFVSLPSGTTTSAESSVSVTVSAASDMGENITYSAETLPRGASLNSATGEVSWKPDSSQVGRNHFAVTATDESGRQSTGHFYITVYGSTTGDKNGSEETPSTGDSGGSAGGGGGGGGTTPTDKPDDKTNADGSDTSSESGENEGNTDNTSTENNSLRFTDIASHAWAEEAIGALATDGIIKGTSANTFSPAANITRADFALFLVRAFDLSSDNTENFADVSANDYFASELAIARNNGIISGIGDNKFAPKNAITRQDMMVIVYRALQKRGVEFGIYDEPQYSDFDTIAPYARDAVSALIGVGIVNGKNGRIAPTDYTTRAEVAVLIKRILDYVK